MVKNCTHSHLSLEDYVAAVLQLVVQCDVEDYELRAIRKISRKHTRMDRNPKIDKRPPNRDGENRKPEKHP